MSLTIHRGLSLLAVASTAVAAGAVAAPAVAQAAPVSGFSAALGLPTCTDVTKVPVYSFYFLIPSVGHNDHNYNCVLGQGNVSGAVLKVQQALNKCYGAGIAEDQNFGPQTESALRGAQNKEQVAADGVYGPATAARLHWPAYSSTDNKFLDTCASVSFLFA